MKEMRDVSTTVYWSWVNKQVLTIPEKTSLSCECDCFLEGSEMLWGQQMSRFSKEKGQSANDTETVDSEYISARYVYVDVLS